MTTPVRVLPLALLLAACAGDDDSQGLTSATTAAPTTTATAGSTSGATDGETSTGGESTTTDGSASGSEGSSTGSTSTSTSDGTTTTGTSSGGTTEPSPNDCCTPHEKPGCADKGVQACICAADLTCCEPTHGWDKICVIEVTSFKCGMCP